jgi:hypothetical protein
MRLASRAIPETAFWISKFLPWTIDALLSAWLRTAVSSWI